MAIPPGGKEKLSKHLRQMKFMQRRSIQEAAEEDDDPHKVIDDEHWVLDVPELLQKESPYIIEPSYVPCEDLLYGRMSFNGFNPEIEKLMKNAEAEKEEARVDEFEKLNTVSDVDMAGRYQTLIGTITNKFKKKRQRKSDPTTSESSDSVPEKKSRTFLKPSDG